MLELVNLWFKRSGLKDCKTLWEKFYSRILPLINRHRTILIQLPPSFRVNVQRCTKVKQTGKYLHRVE